MNNDSPLWKAYETAKSKCETEDWAENYEAEFVAFLTALKTASETEQNEYKKYFCQLIQSQEKIHWELMAFVMHDLRWPEVLECLKREIPTTSNERRRPVLVLVTEAYSEAWWGRKAYKYYRNQFGLE
jgi:hypothetical protein